jgi:hypothetical protein
MRAPRKLVPSVTPVLESRVVPSQMGLHPGEFRPVRLSAAEIAQSNQSALSFGEGVSATIKSGLPVAEQVTIRYSDGSTQTESLEKLPDSSNNTVTTYETINLRNNGGTETVVDTESFSGGLTPFSGDDNTHTIMITLPDGSTESELYHELIAGNKTTVSGSIDEAGGVEIWTSVKLRHGKTTTTEKTVTEPDGLVEYQNIVTINHGALDSTTVTMTRVRARDEVLYLSSATDRVRVAPPSV